MRLSRPVAGQLFFLLAKIVIFTHPLSEFFDHTLCVCVCVCVCIADTNSQSLWFVTYKYKAVRLLIKSHNMNPQVQLKTHISLNFGPDTADRSDWLALSLKLGEVAVWNTH